MHRKEFLLLVTVLYSVQSEERRVRDHFLSDESQSKKIWENWDPDPVPFADYIKENKKEQTVLWSEPPASSKGPLPPLELPDPSHQGLLKDIGGINVGFGVGVGIPGNDPVSVGTRVGVDFGESGLAGEVPIGENIFPRRGEQHSLNDYDGNKQLIAPDKASKWIQAVREGRIRLVKYQQPKSLVGVTGGIGIGK